VSRRRDDDAVPRKTPDDVDTAKIAGGHEDDELESVSAEVGPGRRYALTLAPCQPMAKPKIHASTRPREDGVLAEQVLCGEVLLYGPAPLEAYREGRSTPTTFSRRTPLVVVLQNSTDKKVTVSVSLVGRGPSDKPGSYRLKKEGQ
jgi:hypothetical protein